MGGGAGGRWELRGSAKPHRTEKQILEANSRQRQPNRTVTPMATDTTRGPQPAAQLKESGGVGGRSPPPPFATTISVSGF